MAWNDAVVTNSGLALLSEVLSGNTLTISAAGAGGGTVEAAALMAQTTLTQSLSDVTVLIAATSDLKQGTGKEIKLQIRNTGLTTAARMKQIGLFAYTDGEPVLFAIMQDETGENIPTESEYPDFMIEFTAAVALSQTDGITVEISGSAVVTAGMLEEKLEDYSTTEEMQVEIKAVSDIVEDLPLNMMRYTELGGTATDIYSLLDTGVYHGSNFKNYPAEAADGQGTVIVINYYSGNTIGNSGVQGKDNMWLKRYFITPHGGKVWDMSVVGTAVQGWSASADGGNAAYVNGHTVESDVPANAVFTDTTYTDATAAKAGLMGVGAQTFAGQKTFNAPVIPAGASDIATAQARKIYAGTTDLEAGVSALETGALYLVYE